MTNAKALRKHAIKLLKGGDAHADFETELQDFPPNLRGKRPEGAEHSPWEILEHLRLAQWDILEFSRNPNHKSPEFPGGYWPATPAPPNEKAWDESVKAYLKDREALCELVSDEAVDLFRAIPHGDGQTVLREALLAADHNAYHLGEFVLLRRILRAWK